MALFKRKSTDKTTLPEIEKYYEAERKERAGLAWLLALVSVAVVSLILIGLFFGGKWAFNRLTDKDEPVAVQTTNENEPQPNGPIDDGNKDNAAAPSTPAPSPAPTPAPTTPANSNLPGTGISSMSIVFVGSAFVAWLFHQAVLRRKFSRY